MIIEKTNEIKYLLGYRDTKTEKVSFFDKIYDKRPVRTDLYKVESGAQLSRQMVVKEVPIYKVTTEKDDTTSGTEITNILGRELNSSIRMDHFYCIPNNQTVTFIAEEEGKFLTDITKQERAYITKQRNKEANRKFSELFMVDTVNALLEETPFKLVESYNKGYMIRFKNSDTFKAFILKALADRLEKTFYDSGIQIVLEKAWQNFTADTALVRLERCKMKKEDKHV